MLVTEHAHPKSGAIVSGIRLAAGASLKAGDLYDGSDGTWATLAVTDGLTLEHGCAVLWVRPGTAPSRCARHLLEYMCARGGEHYATIGERAGTYYLLPTPSFNWDGRMHLPRVSNPECLQECLDYGLLQREMVPVNRRDADHAMAPAATNTVYTLTDLGKRYGLRSLVC